MNKKKWGKLHTTTVGGFHLFKSLFWMLIEKGKEKENVKLLHSPLSNDQWKPLNVTYFEIHAFLFHKLCNVKRKKFSFFLSKETKNINARQRHPIRVVKDLCYSICTSDKKKKVLRVEFAIMSLAFYIKEISNAMGETTAKDNAIRTLAQKQKRTWLLKGQMGVVEDELSWFVDMMLQDLFILCFIRNTCLGLPRYKRQRHKNTLAKTKRSLIAEGPSRYL